MKNLISFTFFLLLIVSQFSCNKNNSTEPWAGENAFQPAQLEMWFDKDTLQGSDTLTIFLRCHPVLPGKGRVVIDKGIIIPTYPLDFWEDSTHFYSAVTFEANVSLLTQWQIQIVSPNAFSGPITGAFVFMDSVYAKDGAQLYHIRSEEAENIYGKIGGAGAGTYPLPIITYYP